MLFRVYSAAVFGIQAYPVSVEVDLSSGQKMNLMMVGLPDTAVRESSERVKAALRNCGFQLPDRHITINLAPADLKKEGSAFDLPMAVGILGASGCVPKQNLSTCLFMGELSLDGTVRPIRGTLSMASMARERGLRRLIVPEENAREAAVVSGVEAFPVRSLPHVVELLSGNKSWIPLQMDPDQLLAKRTVYDVDFRDVKGQYQARRAMEVARVSDHGSAARARRSRCGSFRGALPAPGRSLASPEKGGGVRVAAKEEGSVLRDRRPSSGRGRQWFASSPLSGAVSRAGDKRRSSHC